MSDTNKTPIIAFYSTSENSGKSTISQAFAYHLAQEGKSVLYVEADYVHPKFAIKTGLSHPEKNMFELLKKQKEFNLLEFIATKGDIVATKRSEQDRISKIPEGFHFLALPTNYKATDCPVIYEKETFIETLLESLGNAPYEYIVVNVPVELSELLSYPILAESDHVINVVHASPYEAIRYQKQMQWLDEINLPLPASKYTIFNFIDESSDYVDELKNLSQVRPDICIPYDSERASYEWTMNFSSPSMQQQLEKLFLTMGIDVTIKPIERRGFFRKFS